MKPFFPSILPPEPIRKPPTVREVGRVACPINFADFNSLTILYSATLEEGEELFVRQDKGEFAFEAKKEISTP
jgi:hypothetical protein